MVENLLHNRYSYKQTINEWFELGLEDVSNFQEICDNIEETIEIMKDNPFFKKKYLKE